MRLLGIDWGSDGPYLLAAAVLLLAILAFLGRRNRSRRTKRRTDDRDLVD